MNAEEQQPSYQQRDTRQVSGRSSPVLEVEQNADQTVNAHERPPVYQQVNGRIGSDSNYSTVNGVVVSGPSFSIQETELVSDQLVSGQQQQTVYQQGGCVEADGVNYCAQETDLHESQSPDRPYYQPEAGADQAGRYNYPVEETGQAAVQVPDENEDRPPCFQLLNVADMNGVSSTGQAEQAMEHSCSRQELRLWNQKLTR